MYPSLFRVFFVVFVSLPSFFWDTNAQLEAFISPESPVNPKDYIVFMSPIPEGLSPKNYYIGVLSSILGSEKAAEEALVYSYRTFPAFCAILSDEQVDSLKKKSGVLGVMEDGVEYLLDNPINS